MENSGSDEPPVEPRNIPAHEDFYRRLRRKIAGWIESKAGSNHQYAEYIMLAPDLFHLLVKLSLDERIPGNKKAKLIGTIAYFISPLDVLPEALVGPAGYLDDTALAAYVLHDLINDTDPDIIREHWAGEKDILKVVQRLLDLADDMIGKGMWSRVKRLFRRKTPDSGSSS